MKVALSFPGCHRRGGVERIMLECARFLVTRGHEVHAFCSDWSPEPLDEVTRAIHLHSIPVPRIPWFLQGQAYMRRCSRSLQLDAYDVLNTHGCVCPFGGVMWTQSVHRAWLEISRTQRGSLSVARWKQWLNPLHPVLLRLERQHFSERRYRRVIATTEAVKADLTRLYDVPADDVVIVPNGFDPLQFNPEQRLRLRDAVREKLDIKPDQVVLLFVANELDRKGYGTILRAMRAINRTDLRLLVVGRAERTRALAMAAAHGLEKYVIVCGSTSDVAHYHAAADLFVLPTQYEAFCLAILEALGSGLPVVTSAVPGAQDAIVAGTNGAILQDPKSGEQLAAALQPLLEKGIRERMSDAAPETVKQFQWPSVLRRYEDVLFACRR